MTVAWMSNPGATLQSIHIYGYEGYAEVEVVPKLPVEGVALLLGNELAGQLVRMAPAFGVDGLQANIFNATVGTLRWSP